MSAPPRRSIGALELLLPRDTPPMSHFGVTLLRHTIAAGIRYAAYHLGASVPEKPLLCIRGLRVRLDRDACNALLGDARSRTLRDALLEPGGAGKPPPGAARGALLFHRTRLACRRWTAAHASPPEPADGPGRAAAVRAAIDGAQSMLRDAVLSEVLTVTERRKRREKVAGAAPPSPGRAAATFLDEGVVSIRLGQLDPMRRDWTEDPAAAERAREARSESTTGAMDLSARDRRGLFREMYRASLGPVRETYRRLAEASGFFDDPDDAFFLPFDLIEDLGSDRRPGWLGEAVRKNRAEYMDLWGGASEERRSRWNAAPLAPLP